METRGIDSSTGELVQKRVLANNGIPARSIAGVFLRLDVAEKVASRLEDLRKIEDRGYL